MAAKEKRQKMQKDAQMEMRANVAQRCGELWLQQTNLRSQLWRFPERQLDWCSTWCLRLTMTHGRCLPWVVKQKMDNAWTPPKPAVVPQAWWPPVPPPPKPPAGCLNECSVNRRWTSTECCLSDSRIVFNCGIWLSSSPGEHPNQEAPAPGWQFLAVVAGHSLEDEKSSDEWMDMTTSWRHVCFKLIYLNLGWLGYIGDYATPWEGL